MANTLSLQESRSRLQSHFEAQPPTAHASRWAALWDAGDFLPFDRGCPNPAFEETLAQKRDILGTATQDSNGDKGAKRKTALVPGCGRGYDVLLLASFGYHAWGLEVSETAVKRCREEQEKNGGRYGVKDGKIGAGSAGFVAGDFFEEQSWIGTMGTEFEGFDLIYDYTFLSALPPSMRPSWSKQMQKLLLPDGNLICVEFPTYKDPASGGPPWGLPEEVYLAHLSHPGEEISYDKNGKVQFDKSASIPRGGLTRLAHWQPERTHEVGKGTDWVSIWRPNSSRS